MVDESDIALMLWAALVAAGHYLAFFSLIAALVLELVLLSESLSADVARRIQRADRAVIIAAILLLIFGFLRVFYFEKGSEYYFSNTFFQIKLGLFIAAALISTIPTRHFSRWNGLLANSQVIDLDAAAVKRLKRIIHWELVIIGAIVVCASLMTKGFGV